jgi:hypothetical protein
VIALRWAERPNGIVGRAYEQAMQIIGDWVDKPEHAAALPYPIGWPHVALAEKIASAILSASGYDESLLEAAIDGDFGPGCTAGDLDAELEHTRAHR